MSVVIGVEKQSKLTSQMLIERIFYDPLTGRLIWKTCRRRDLLGAEVGYLHNSRYRAVEFPEGRFFAHRLAWLYMTGNWPSGQIDHKDGDGLNNRWENLRIATHQQNMANRKAQGGRPLKGITRAYGGKWRALIREHGKQIAIGTFETAEEAHAAYAKRAVELHGEFARAQ